MKIILPTPPSFSARAYFWCLICSNILLICSNSFENLQQLFQICSKFILFAATLFYLQQRFNLQHNPYRPPHFPSLWLQCASSSTPKQRVKTWRLIPKDLSSHHLVVCTTSVIDSQEEGKIKIYNFSSSLARFAPQTPIHNARPQ